ncbi:MAG TPA: protein kinase, partial [Candidatus Limnocylindrales bacterium]|nr:protein kinase [Candidatus Limnocylindrales bacterium]
MTQAPSRLGDRYRIGEPIARGGMATVYRGSDEQLDRPVAIKLMRPDLGEDPQFVQRFEAEARRAASVTHPGLVAVYDVGTEEGMPYIVMELVPGGDLAAAVRHGPMAPQRAARIASDVAAALEAAHRAGLVHRDVKPGNILLGADGRARVADFGIARATGEESLTRTGAMLGSVEYFSPEQARGERASPASDIYGLGVVLYELLTGARPFSGDSPYAVATARLRQAVPDPRHANPEVPAALAAIVMRAMAVEPSARYRSAKHMRAALERWLDATAAPAAVAAPASAQPAASRSVEPANAAATTSPRRRGSPPWRAALSAVLLLGAVAFVGAWLIGDRSDGDPGVANPIEVIIGTPGGQAEEPTATPEPTPDPTPRPTVD